jgi:hypothetical protein
MKTLKKIGKIYGIFLVIYWSIAGIMALGSAGWNWGASSFDRRVFKAEFKKRFLP